MKALVVCISKLSDYILNFFRFRLWIIYIIQLADATAEVLRVHTELKPSGGTRTAYSRVIILTKSLLEVLFCVYSH